MFLPAGTPISQAADTGSEEAAQMRELVKAAMVHSWDGYRRFAWGFDELAPPYKRGKRGAAPGATILDSMSTLKIMGLESRFGDAVAWVKAFDFQTGGKVSFFETTIRDLGGLLSAYDLTGDPALLAKAAEIGDGLMGAFGTKKEPGGGGVGIPWAEVRTCLLCTCVCEFFRASIVATPATVV